MSSLRLTDYCGAPQRNKELNRVFALRNLSRVHKICLIFYEHIADRLGAFTHEVSAPFLIFCKGDFYEKSRNRYGK